jgi:hypothetical protein
VGVVACHLGAHGGGCSVPSYGTGHYICVIGEVEDYYGVHKIIAFNDIFVDSPIFNRNIVNGVSNMTWWKYSKPQLIPTEVKLRKNM